MAHTASEQLRDLTPRAGYRPPFADDGAASWAGPLPYGSPGEPDPRRIPAPPHDVPPSELFWGAG